MIRVNDVVIDSTNFPDGTLLMKLPFAVKPSYDVKVGDIVEIKFGDKISKFEILEIPKVAGKDLPELIKII